MSAPEQPTAGTGDQIIDAAQELFLTSGYEGTGMKAIAEKVGISTPALYWHFPSKEEIYQAAMERALSQFLEAVRVQVEAEDPVERLGQIVRAHVRHQLERLEVVDAFQPSFRVRGALRPVPRQASERMIAAQRGYLDELKDVLERGREAGEFDFDDTTVTAFGLLTLCEYPNVWFDPAGPLSAGEVAELYVELALAMLASSASEAPRAAT